MCCDGTPYLGRLIRDARGETMACGAAILRCQPCDVEIRCNFLTLLLLTPRLALCPNIQRLKRLPDEMSGLEKASLLDSDAPTTLKRFQGWRFGVLMCTVSTCLVLLLNVCLSIGVLGRLGWGRDGQPILQEGQCNNVSKLSTIVHIFINAMSTALLSASGYCMQCLSAPTRQDLELAHQSQSWLDIGVLSPRNIRSVSSNRRRCWIILGLSTIPLHLL